MDTGVNLAIIAAVAENQVIGKNGDLPWNLPDDLKHFKRITEHHTVVAGRKTHEAIVARLGHPLRNRRTMVFTRNIAYQAKGVDVVTDWTAVMRHAMSTDDEVFLIGGGELYRWGMAYAKTMYLTVVHAKPQGDALFPAWNKSDWTRTEIERHEADAKNECAFTFETWKRSSR